MYKRQLQPSVIEIAEEAEELLQEKQFQNVSPLENIKNQAHNLEELLEDTIALNKLDQEENLLPDHVNTADLIHTALTKQQSGIKKLDLQVQKQINGNKWVSSYQRELEQIIQNLISNAVKYNRPHGTVAITLEHNEVENYLNITVEDSGIGIAATEQKRIFERFYQVDPKQNQGTGLGLAIVEEAAQTLNGTVKLTSKLHEGTKVMVHLPL